ncbi:MAG: aminotransferase class V-fold PLP-dependent enzyme, partial [Saprospiraceae bacterium]|nr:aminotransferase class V-fold PLP-dependent enzyme [Saprospiraceae bacterium]
HHCVLHTADRLATAGVQVERLPVDELGRMDYAGLEARIQTGAGHTLVSLMHANNEIGTMIDLRRVGDLCREAGVLFHSDTVQTMGHFPF